MGRKGAASKPSPKHSPALVAAASPPPALTKALLAFHDSVSPGDRHGPIEGHPESADRVSASVARLRGNREVWRALRKLPPRRATDSELQLCHDESHITGLQRLAQLSGEDGKGRFVPASGPVCMGGPCCEVREGTGNSDTYVTSGSIEAARLSVGGLLNMVDNVMGGGSSSSHCGLALCRPPGHHASRNRSSGFCLFNNVAVAASYALDRYPEVSRVMIFDWDVHHGQGTQHIFEHSSDVLVINAHRHDGHSFYPATGGSSEVGLGPGRGYNINVALPQGYGGAALWSVCANVVVPAARSFKPDLIVVSAGFDAARGDPLGGCAVPPQAFGALTAELRALAWEVAGGRLLMALEGGYHLEVLPDCVEEVARALVQDFDIEGGADPFAEPPAWLEGSLCLGAIRRACEAHHALALKLPLPASKAERRQKTAVGVVAAPPQEQGKSNGAAQMSSCAAVSPDDSTTAKLDEVQAVATPAVSPLPSCPSSSLEGGDSSSQPPPKEDAGPAQSGSDGPSGGKHRSRRKKAHHTNGSTVAAAVAPNGDDEPGPELADQGAAADVPHPPPQVFAGHASLELSPSELVVRLSPVQRPKDILVSSEELWIWPGDEVGSEEPQKWRFQGVCADPSGTLRCVEFRRRKREITVRLSLGPILGGAVGLVPISA